MLIAEKDESEEKEGPSRINDFRGCVCVVWVINSLRTHGRQTIAWAERPFRSVGGNSLRKKAIFKDLKINLKWSSPLV